MYCILHCWIARLLSIKLLTSRVPMSFSSREETNRRSRLSGPVGSLKNLPNSTQATSSRLSQRPKRCRRLTIALWFTRIQQLPWSLKCSEICKEGQVFLKSDLPRPFHSQHLTYLRTSRSAQDKLRLAVAVDSHADVSKHGAQKVDMSCIQGCRREIDGSSLIHSEAAFHGPRTGGIPSSIVARWFERELWVFRMWMWCDATISWCCFDVFLSSTTHMFNAWTSQSHTENADPKIGNCFGIKSTNQGSPKLLGDVQNHQPIPVWFQAV